MPLFPNNSTRSPSGLAEHGARPGLAPIAQDPVVMEEEDLGNSPGRPSFTSPQHLAPANHIRPPPWTHELHHAVMTQESSGYVLTWNSVTQDDLQLRNSAVIDPMGHPRPVTPSMEPLDIFPRHSTELQAMVRAALPDLDQPSATPSATPIGPPPPLERHGLGGPPLHVCESPYAAYQQATRTPCASVFPDLSPGQLLSSDGDWGSLSISLSLALNSALFLELDEASSPDRTPEHPQAPDALLREIPATQVPDLLTAHDQTGPVDAQCQDDADSPLQLTGLNSPHSSAHYQ